MVSPPTPHAKSSTTAAAPHAKSGNTAGSRIDPARFARDGSRLTGTVSPAQLTRAAQELFDTGGAVDYRVEGLLSPQGEPALRVELAIDIGVACQRCMERLRIALEVGRTLVLSPGLDEFGAIAEEDDDVDAIPLVASLDVLDLIDQELMLSLPIAPRHADGECEARPDAGPDSTQTSPFSVLSQLKQT